MARPPRPSRRHQQCQLGVSRPAALIFCNWAPSSNVYSLLAPRVPVPGPEIRCPGVLVPARIGRLRMHISSLIDDLEDAIASGSAEKRLSSLWSVIDLFMASASRYSDEHVALFDDVILKLAA